ncbi:hypothetical protein KY285_030572 [Solanum tuberosum]|nr:hypothetical protein KY285_030572 [Solanum tuberosum]
MSSSYGLEIVQFKESCAMICQSIVQPRKHSKFPRGSVNRTNWEKEVKTGEVRYLPVEKALDLQSGIEKYGSPLINIVSTRVEPIESMAIVTQGHFSNPSVQISNLLPEKSAVQRSLGSVGYTRPQNLQNAKITKQSQKIVQLSKGPSGSTILEHRSPTIVNESRMKNSFMAHPCDPALVLSWKSERYIALVEFMRTKDLVMRTLINDVELLILASTTLCSDSQRWNSEHFLWGLFYRPGQNTDGCAEGGSNKVIDMEIDMIAGEDVGTLDIVLHSWS